MSVPHQRAVILCVDDEPQVLEGLKLHLNRHYRVLTASDGSAGLDALGRDPDVAVIVSDMRMPLMDGATFLRRAREVAPDATRILLTGQYDVTSAVSAVNDGQVFRFLTKPCASTQLLGAVGAAASQHRHIVVSRLLMEQNIRLGDAGFDLQQALKAVIEQVCRLFDAPFGAVGLHETPTWPPADVATIGLDPGLFRQERDMGGSVPMRLLASSGAMHLEASADEATIAGLPAGHPAATRLIGTPLSLQGRNVGWIYLAGSAALSCSTEDQRIVGSLGSGLATLWEHNQARQAARRATTELLQRGEQLQILSLYDSLTRLANRRLFSDRLRDALIEARRISSRVALVIVDIDRFKAINDTHGNAAGDEVLRRVGERLVVSAGDPMRVARIGDNRFALIMPSLAQEANVAALINETVLAPLCNTLQAAGAEVRLSAKIGGAMFPDDGADAESLMRNAEAALKKARASGERVLLYTQELGAAVSQKLSLEQRLRNAVDREELRLYYQPKLDIRTNRICGAEALLRWESPDLGLVPPLQFIGLLEETGLILEVGPWALRQACAHHRQWVAQGLPPVPIAVNVSAVQLQQPDFIDGLRAALGPASSNPGLALEITESMLMADVEGTVAKLKKVRDMGIQVAIDDFGTGYSSLSYLARLPVSTVKIDRSFVVRMGDSADTVSIVSSIISLAHSLGLKVIAEGVDSAEQLKFLRLLRCDEYQGFLFSEALTPGAFIEMLRGSDGP